MSTYTDDEIREHRKLWTEALRSGDYKQAKSRLEVNGAFCCLGVACIVAEQHGIRVARTSVGAALWGHELQGRQRAVYEWLGLDRPRFLRPSARTLSGMNDEAGLSFDTIADYIEAAA